MNTTNLLTDYIIAGVLGLLCFIMPYLMIDPHYFKVVIGDEIKNTTILAVFISVIAYSFGVVFNQFADRVEDFIYWIFCYKGIKELESKLGEDLGIDHHFALQYIVHHSNNGYDYISFRRTMIRILRSALCLLFLLPIIHILYASVCHLSGMPLQFSLANCVICALGWTVSLFLVLGLIKLYKGYYGAITNFVKVIRQKVP